MTISPLAGKPAPPDLLIDVDQLVAAYYANQPELSDPTQLVAFGTSGHRGTPFEGSFTEAHILAITQAICDYRRREKISGPLFMGKDTHAASDPAQRTAVEVLAANNVETVIQVEDRATPTPVISRAILVYNRGKKEGLADGIVVTPSHNPPGDGGFEYNPPDGGPADTDITSWIQERANQLLQGGNREVKRLSYEAASHSAVIHPQDYIPDYVADLAGAIDIEIIRESGIKIGVDPLGGASLNYWQPLAERYNLDIEVVNQAVDPTFRFMTVDHDGKIRMDCSSPYAMAGLVGLKEQYDIAWGTDPDADRHGIVTRSLGLLNPNAYLAVAIDYLLRHRADWSQEAQVGKTLVSSSLIDRVVASAGRKLCEVPVGFKWLAPGLYSSSFCFGGEESAGASFLRRDGSVWTTDKDGLLLGMLAAEITARTGKDPGVYYQELSEKLGASWYTRIDTPSTPAQKSALSKLSPKKVAATQLAGYPITARLALAPCNDAPIGGIKVISSGGWFAARPSGTEDVYKLYAESYHSEDHLAMIVGEAQLIISRSVRA